MDKRKSERAKFAIKQFDIVRRFLNLIRATSTSPFPNIVQMFNIVTITATQKNIGNGKIFNAAFPFESSSTLSRFDLYVSLKNKETPIVSEDDPIDEEVLHQPDT